MTKTVAAALILTAGLAYADKKQPPPPDHFPMGKNYVWDYESTTDAGKKSNFSVKVIGVDNGTWQMDTVNEWQTIQQFFTRPPGWIIEHKEVYPKNNMVAEFKPTPRQYLQNPLSAGATWSWSGTGMMDVSIQDSASVSGPEEVVVPAGKFSAMKVTSNIVQGGTPVTKMYWYANHVGLVKSYTDTGSVKSTTVLLKYNFPKP